MFHNEFAAGNCVLFLEDEGYVGDHLVAYKMFQPFGEERDCHQFSGAACIPGDKFSPSYTKFPLSWLVNPPPPNV